MGRFYLNVTLLTLLVTGQVLGACGRVGYESVELDPDAGMGGQSGNSDASGRVPLDGGTNGGAGVDASVGGTSGMGGDPSGGTGGTIIVDAGNGGAATGGTATGGTRTGGRATGGMGGMATGGMATGGMATGGMATGGMATGGTAGTDAPPATPSGFAATAGSPKSIDLRWNPSAENDFSHYILYRSTMPGFLIAQGTVVNANIKLTAFTDGERPECTTIYYRLVAVDMAGNRSTPTAIVQATTLGSELVVNGSFEQGGTGWPPGWVDPTNPGGRTTTVASGGNASLNVKGVDFGGTTRPSVAVALVPLRMYRLSGKARVPSDLKGLGLQGGYYHLVNNFPVALAFSSFLRTGSEAWVSFSADFTVPANYVSGYVQLFWGLPEAGEEGFFDEISLREVCQ